MKASLRSQQEPRRVSNGVIIAAMLLSLCVLSIVKARYCSTPFGKPDDQLKEKMNSSIRMETDDEPAPAATTVGVSEEHAEEDVEEDGAAPVPKVTTERAEKTAVVSGADAGKKDKDKGNEKKKKPTYFMTSKRPGW